MVRRKPEATQVIVYRYLSSLHVFPRFNLTETDVTGVLPSDMDDAELLDRKALVQREKDEEKAAKDEEKAAKAAAKAAKAPKQQATRAPARKLKTP